LEATLEKVKASGGAIVVAPMAVKAEGFRFAMFEDPECNVVGLIEMESQSPSV